MKKIFTILGVALLATAGNAQIVISEVYGGGGGTTATYANDYVELVNLGSSPTTLTGANLQYGSATGTFNSYAPLPSITLNPGQKFLIEMVPSTAATAGATLPTADLQITSNISLTNGNTYQGGFNMAAANGKIALANSTTAVTAANGANVIDFVGYGTSNLFEGSGAAPALDATKSATRQGADTNNNAVDFTAANPTPENKNSLAVTDVNGVKINLVKNTNVNNTIVFGAKANVQILNVNGQVVKTASVVENTNLDVSSLAKGMYIISADVNGQKVSQKIIKN
ncbi:MAG: lamin tail domain-containing protein [Flavobacteriales bacterium]|nr:lamin tail domain-containing protein [Flavobacteriales bacterium]